MNLTYILFRKKFYKKFFMINQPLIHIKIMLIYLQKSNRLLNKLGVLVVFSAINLLSTPTSAKTTAINPEKLGSFCPDGSQIVNAKHTNLISIKIQTEIKNKIMGFMHLDAEARRAGNPMGSMAYWKMGYTTEFDDTKDVPIDGLEYLDFKYQNICSIDQEAIVILLMDVVQIGNGTLAEVWVKTGRFLSMQKFWDAFTHKEIQFTKHYEYSIPDQPLVFTAIPIFKGKNGAWLIDQKKVMRLVKFNRKDWETRINKTNTFAECNAKMKTRQYSQERCALRDIEKSTLLKISRPAWSVPSKTTQTN